MVVDIKRNDKRPEYWEVFIDGELYCTADNYLEAVQECQDYMNGRNV